jgi:hypothetical protein
MVLLFLLVMAFLAFAVPPYLSFDPAQSRIPPPPGNRAYYPLLVAHVLFASVAMTAGCLQIWPWLRRRHPEAHRRVGRAYVFGGVLPAGLTGLAIGVMGPFGPVLRASNVLLALLWLTSTAVGFRMALRGRQADHRRWMTRSVTLTLSIITNRVWAVVFTLALAPHLPTMFGGSEAALVQAIAGLSGWLGWVVPLVAVEWWLVERGAAGGDPALALALAPARR